MVVREGEVLEPRLVRFLQILVAGEYFWEKVVGEGVGARSTGALESIVSKAFPALSYGVGLVGTI